MTPSPYRDLHLIIVASWLLTALGIVAAFIWGDLSMATGCGIFAIVVTIIRIIVGREDKQ